MLVICGSIHAVSHMRVVSPSAPCFSQIQIPCSYFMEITIPGRGPLGIYTLSAGFSWVTAGFSWVTAGFSRGSAGFSWVQLGSAGFSWVQLGLTYINYGLSTDI